MAAKQGPFVLFCMPNRTSCTLLVSVMSVLPPMFCLVYASPPVSIYKNACGLYQSPSTHQTLLPACRFGFLLRDSVPAALQVRFLVLFGMQNRALGPYLAPALQVRCQGWP
jgi:hypothetical protein